MTTISLLETTTPQALLHSTVDAVEVDSIEHRLLDIAASSEERLRLRSIYELQEWLAEIRELAQGHASKQ